MIALTEKILHVLYVTVTVTPAPAAAHIEGARRL
jgi:hypothetical protein